jgi:hypothetical protein
MKGILGPKVTRIEMVHPTIPKAEEFHYQIWPEDKTDSWHEITRASGSSYTLATCTTVSSFLYHGMMNSGLKSDPFDGYLRLR